MNAPSGLDVPGLADVGVLMRRASTLLQEGRTGAARPLLAAVRRMAPPSAEIAHLSARLAMCDGRLAEATDELDGAIALEPGDAALRKLRAELRLRCEDLPGAATDAAEAVVLQGSDPAAKALLGVVLLRLGSAADAAACLAEAVRTEPANAAFVQGLAAALEVLEDFAQASAVLDAGIVACPHATALRNDAVLLRIRQGDCDGALACAEAARRLGVADACTFGLKGHALSTLGRHDEAGESYQEALKLAPEDPYVRHLVAASGALPGASRAPEPYLRAVFNGYAARFEAHILALGYRVPGLVRGALLRHLPLLDQGVAAGPVLDLGCGTGLMAVACSDLPLGPWEGIDISSGMLAEAAAKGSYDALHEADLVGWLGAEQRRWAIILAADVFCYFGALEETFVHVRRCLGVNGLCILSLEERIEAPEGAEDGSPGWVLRRQGRYAHELRYLETAARRAGLRVRELNRQVLRRDGGLPVPGLLAVLERAH